MTERLLSVAEVAEVLRKSTRFVADELRRKRLAGSKYGGEWHVTRADVDAYIEAHRNVRPVVRRRSA
jgi:excisionase family DNA binding protein